MKRFILTLLALSTLFMSMEALAKNSIEKETETALLEAIRERASYPDETVLTVRTLRPSDTALFRGAKSLLSLVLPPGESGTGTITAQVQIETGGKRNSEKMLWVMARVDVQVPTLVMTRAISRGTLLSESDMALELRPIGRNIQDINLALGKIVRRNMREGEVIQENGLQAPIVIKRGEIVDASVSGRSFSVRTKAESLAKGGIGDTIRTKILKTGKIVHARIKAPGVVELLL